jgi:hypothetical protein
MTTGGEGRAATCQNAEASNSGGGGGIRTHGSFRFGGFQDRRANRFGGPRFRAIASLLPLFVAICHLARHGASMSTPAPRLREHPQGFLS